MRTVLDIPDTLEQSYKYTGYILVYVLSDIEVQTSQTYFSDN